MTQESTLMADVNGRELFLGDVVRALIEEPFQHMHGKWAEYEIGKGAGGYVLLYVQSESGCQLPFGYTATFMNQFHCDDMDFKQLIWAKTPVRHPALQRIDCKLTPDARRELFTKESKERRK